MKPQEFLAQLKLIEVQIECKLEEVARLKALEGKMTAQMGGERVQSSSSQDPMGNAVAKRIDTEREIGEYFCKLYDLQQYIISILNQMQNPVYYNILHKMYVGITEEQKDGTTKTKYLDFYEVAELYRMSYSWATTTHGRALEEFKQIWHEREKNEQRNI